MSRRKRKKNPKTLERSRRNARKAAQRLAVQLGQPDGRNCVARVSNAAVARPMGVSVALAGTLGTGALEAIPGPNAIPLDQVRRNCEADVAAREQHMRALRNSVDRDHGHGDSHRAREMAKRIRREGAAPPPPAPRHGQSRFTAVVLAMAALGGCPLDYEPPPPPPPLKRPPWGKEPL